MSITFSTSWYMFKSKFFPATYERWIKNFLFVTENCNVVIYTDEESKQVIPSTIKNKKNFKIIIKPLSKFYNYKYQFEFQENHKKNGLLNNITEWKVNTLWCEKVHFVHETMEKKYFDTDFYAWCDIGYFRNNLTDVNVGQLMQWPNKETIKFLNKNKIHYACVNNDEVYIQKLFRCVTNKDKNGIPRGQIPANQISIAGGFFIAHRDKVTWWRDTFDNKLKLYFKHNALVKDDQIIIADCVFSNLKEFSLHKENNPKYDNWFLFQRVLK